MTEWTDLEPWIPPVVVSDDDMFGPLPSKPTASTDWYLVFSWVFILVCAVHYGLKSSLAEKLKDVVGGMWRESNENAEASEEARREETEETARLREAEIPADTGEPPPEESLHHHVEGVGGAGPL